MTNLLDLLRKNTEIRNETYLGCNFTPYSWEFRFNHVKSELAMRGNETIKFIGSEHLVTLRTVPAIQNSLKLADVHSDHRASLGLVSFQCAAAWTNHRVRLKFKLRGFGKQIANAQPRSVSVNHTTQLFNQV